MRQTSRTGTKVGVSDPAVAYGSAVAQRIKGTPGIRSEKRPVVPSDVFNISIKIRLITVEPLDRMA